MKKRIISLFICLLLSFTVITAEFSDAAVQQYTVSFNANGGSGSMESVTVSDSTYKLPGSFFRAPANTYFAGWSLSPDGEALLVSSITLEGDTVLYALWERNPHIIDNTKTEYNYDHDIYSTVYMINNQIIENPGDSRYLDSSYSVCNKADASYEITDISVGEYVLVNDGENTIFSNTTTLTAIRYVSIYSGGVTIGGNGSGLQYSITATEFHYENTDVYYTNDTYESIATVSVIPVEENLSEFTVSFNMNGHGNQIPEKTVSEGESIDKPADPAEDGYIFSGWYSDEAMNEAYDFASTVTEDTILHAKWIKKNTDETDTPDEPVSPATGDCRSIAAFVSLAIAAAVALLMLSSKHDNA